MNKKIFFFKRRRKNDIKEYYKNFVEKDSSFIIYIDSSRELTFRFFLLYFLKKVLSFKTVLLLTSVCSSISSSISLRKPLNSFSIWISKKLFPNNLQHIENGVFGFYNYKVVILLFILRNNKFNPWYEGCSKSIDTVYSRYPINKKHKIELQKFQSKIILRGEFYSKDLVQIKKTKNTLFAMPQFYEQGIMSKEKSNSIILRMLKFVEEKEGEFPDIILHPRTNKKDYEKYSLKLYQHNLTEILPYYKNYYTINSSTIFLAISNKCNCFVFKFDELDYSFLQDLINNNSVKIININNV